jgi:hypothetical protein
MENNNTYKENTPFENIVERLLQQYIHLESTIQSDNKNESLRIIQQIDKTYDTIFRDLHFFDIRKSDLWLYDNLKHADKSRQGMNHVFNHLTDKLMDDLDQDNRERARFNREGTKTLVFNKENGIWYIDLPDFLEMGLGTKADLMMVDGADTFLDKLSKNTNSVKVFVALNRYDGFEARISMINKGMNQDLLVQKGHAPVDYGAYYKLDVFNGAQSDHVLWLCPVAEYVFGGSYPKMIWLNVME